MIHLRGASFVYQAPDGEVALRLDDAFHSWWFIGLSAFLCLNLLCCNLIRLPALLTVLKEINIPRLPSVSGVLRGEQAEIVRMTGETLEMNADRTGLAGSATRVVSTERPVMTRKTVWIEGTPAEQTGKLRSFLQEGGLIC